MQQTIRHASFAFKVEAPDPAHPGKTILAERKAWQGDTVDIPFEEDIERGNRFGAFVTPSTPPALGLNPDQPVVISSDAEEIEESSVGDMSDGELIEWIKRDKPTVRTIVDAAEGEPEHARRLLDAEDKATGGDSRSGVVKALTSIINQPQ